MKQERILYKSLTLLIAMVWIVNGLFCKLLNLVPRHQAIVSRILGEEYAVHFTRAIGVAEIFMGIWILSGVNTRLNAIIQIFVVIVMNLIELILVPDLLLFGEANFILALLFIIILYYAEFVLKQNLSRQT